MQRNKLAARRLDARPQDMRREYADVVATLGQASRQRELWRDIAASIQEDKEIVNRLTNRMIHGHTPVSLVALTLDARSSIMADTISTT